MRLDLALRLSFYLTLFLACVCLSYAELMFLPWIYGFLAVVVILLAVAYVGEGRWILSANAANRLGLVIGLAILLWIFFQLPRSDEELVAGGVPWPAGLLPHLGPLLMVLLLVKLFRPKLWTDFWSIQTIGLMMVMLGSVLAGEPGFGLLLVGYLASALWCLSLFYLYRGQFEAASGSGLQLSFLAPWPASPRLPWGRLGVGSVLRWIPAVVIFGLTLFLAAPRQGNTKWDPLHLRTKTGAPQKFAPDEGMMDLNRVGKVQLNEEVAFLVKVEDAAGVAKLDLNPQQRWRGETLDHYEQGRWFAGSRKMTYGHWEEVIESSNPELPMLGPDQLKFTFKVDIAKAGTIVLAEPVRIGSGVGNFPFLHKPSRGTPRPNLFVEIPGTGILWPKPIRRHEYAQVLVPPIQADLTPALRLSPPYQASLASPRMPEQIPPFTRQILTRLPDMTDASEQAKALDRLHPQHHQQVARALTKYLATSGYYTYTLNLRRQDKSADPMVDFLIHVKQGHCERYAGGLTLMLRSLGIPARVVKGFCGADSQGDGWYQVRQNQAHSWVEALVPDDDHPGQWNWLALDPTPSQDISENLLGNWLTWLAENFRDSRAMWRDFILDYDTEKQVAAGKDIWNNLTTKKNLARGGRILFFLTLAILSVFLSWVSFRLVKHYLRRPASSNQALASTFKSYARLLRILAGHCQLRPGPGQTPREFGQAAQEALRRHPQAATLADLPLQVVTLLYRIRFGGMTLDQAEEMRVEKQIGELEASFQSKS